MATPAKQRVPEGMHTLTPHLWFSGNCGEALDFYQRALGAELIGEIVWGPDGTSVVHAMVRIGSSMMMVADAWPGMWEQAPKTGTTAGLWIYVEDCDALFHRAVKAGAEVQYPLDNMFWGDRMGKLKDPYGHCWAIAPMHAPTPIARAR